MTEHRYLTFQFHPHPHSLDIMQLPDGIDFNEEEEEEGDVSVHDVRNDGDKKKCAAT